MKKKKDDPGTMEEALDIWRRELTETSPGEVAVMDEVGGRFHSLAKQLEAESLRRKIGQRELGRKTGIDSGNLSKIFAGKKDPRLSTASRIAAELGLVLVALPAESGARVRVTAKARASAHKSPGRRKTAR